MKIDWKSKLTSRKFWAAVVGFVTALLTALNMGNDTISRITLFISAFSVLIAYIVGEGLVDAANAGSTTSSDTNALVSANQYLSPVLSATETTQPATIPTVKTPDAQATADAVPVPYSTSVQ